MEQILISQRLTLANPNGARTSAVASICQRRTRKQKKWRKFKVQLFGGQSIVQCYEFDETHLNDGTLRFLRFDGYSKDWAEFILANRQN